MVPPEFLEATACFSFTFTEFSLSKSSQCLRRPPNYLSITHSEFKNDLKRTATELINAFGNYFV